MPMFLARREDHDVARTNFLDRPALALRPAAARRDDEDLTKRVRMPGRARAGLERDCIAGRTRGSSHRKQRVNADHPGELLRWPFGRRRCEPARLISIRRSLCGEAAALRLAPCFLISSRVLQGWAPRTYFSPPCDLKPSIKRSMRRRALASQSGAELT